MHLVAADPIGATAPSPLDAEPVRPRSAGHKESGAQSNRRSAKRANAV